MGIPDPKNPVRADHRFIKQVMKVIMNGKVEYVPEEFDFIARIFGEVGGSWKRIFQGSPADIDLLKKVIRRSYDQGFLTKKRKWGPGGTDKSRSGRR